MTNNDTTPSSSASKLSLGNGMVVYRSAERGGSRARVAAADGCVDVSVGNGTSYFGVYLSVADAREMATALLLAADAAGTAV